MKWHYDTLHNDTQHNDIQHKNTQHYETQHTGSALMLIVTYAECHTEALYAECRYAECCGAMKICILFQ
jgi:hypothetical protein